MFSRRCLALVALVFCLPAMLCAAEPVALGGRRELFVDAALLEPLAGRAQLRLHHPMPREVALTLNEPWEGNSSGYATVIQEGDRYRMYYRGHRYLLDPPPLRQAQSEVVCYAESDDGIHWKKPALGLFDWPPTQNNTGNKQNNIFWRGGAETHNFAPFLDTNPQARPDEKYKAVGGTISSKGLLSFASADGIHWRQLSATPVVTQGAFDSHNTVFWDPAHQRYTMYTRFFSEDNFKGLRSIGVSFSTDFRTWSTPVGLTYPDSPPQQMYTNQIYESIKESGAYTGAEVTDGCFMTSRDGQAFHRWDEAFLRPGREAEGRWIYGDNYQSYGLFETKAEAPGLPNEISLHFIEGAWRDEQHRLRRYTMRLDGFVSLNAPFAGGIATTVPLTFTGQRLTLNFETSAAGSLRVAILDAAGQALPGFGLADCDELFGDTVDRTVTWRDSADLAALAGRTIRLQFELKDADLYSFRFQPAQ